jgi:hypothetical protein
MTLTTTVCDRMSWRGWRWGGASSRGGGVGGVVEKRCARGVVAGRWCADVWMFTTVAQVGAVLVMVEGGRGRRVSLT